MSGAAGASRVLGMPRLDTKTDLLSVRRPERVVWRPGPMSVAFRVGR